MQLIHFGVPCNRYTRALEGEPRPLLTALHKQALLRGSDAKASMLQDVLKHRRTEIDYLNGFVSDEGKRVGVDTPFCDAASNLVRSAGVGLLEPDPTNLVRVVESMAFEKREALEEFRRACDEIAAEKIPMRASI